MEIGGYQTEVILMYMLFSLGDNGVTRMILIFMY